MSGWGKLMDGYLAEYRARGVSAGLIGRTTSILECWGRWMRMLRPRVQTESIDVGFMSLSVQGSGCISPASTIRIQIQQTRSFGSDRLAQTGGAGRRRDDAAISANVQAVRT